MSGILASSLFSTSAHAEWQIAPQNSHSQYSTYGLFQDEQSMLVFAGAGRAYGGLGGSFAILGNPESDRHAQLVLLGSATTALTFASPGGIRADEIDLHAGAAFEFTLNPMMRLSVGYLIYSGHTADGATDVDLLSAATPAIEDHVLFARFIYDLGPYARVGATLTPIVKGTPAAQFFGANQFVEIFPWSGQDDQTHPSPYLALGLSENGTERFGNTLSFHAQLGAYFGNHFAQGEKPTFRPVVGFYTGADPRLKYFQYKDKTQTFVYAGVMFGL